MFTSLLNDQIKKKKIFYEHDSHPREAIYKTPESKSYSTTDTIKYIVIRGMQHQADSEGSYSI